MDKEWIPMREEGFPQGADIYEMEVHRCAEGGLLWEVYKEEGFGQLAIRTVPPGKVAGGHRHPTTNEWWFVFKGQATVYLESAGGIREMIHVDADRNGPRLLPLPAGTGHDIKAIGDKPLAFIFFADRIYDPETHDKEPWSWSKGGE